MRATPLRIAVLISGRGSNMAAIARACALRQLDATVVAVVADRPEAAGIAVSHELGLPTSIVHFRDHVTRSDFEAALGAVLAASRPDVIALAGFMRILSDEFVDTWTGRMLNIHPSLLPRHRGLNTHRLVLEAGDRQHGASVHYVTRELDGGPLVLQSRLTVRPGETEPALSGRVQATEHIIYPRALGWIAAGRLSWQDGPRLDGRELSRPVVEEFD